MVGVKSIAGTLQNVLRVYDDVIDVSNLSRRKVEFLVSICNDAELDFSVGVDVGDIRIRFWELDD